MGLKTPIAAFIFVVGGILSVGAADDPVAPLAEQAQVEQAAPVPPAPAVAVPSEGLVSLDFQDADIRNVLKVLSYKSGVNIVAGPEVTGTVTIQLTDVPWQKALDVILVTYGYGYEHKGNIITVTTLENLKKRRQDDQTFQDQEPLVTKTYPLSFAKASDVMESINKVKTGRGNISFDQRTNVLIVRDVAGNMELLDGIVKTLDSATPPPREQEQLVTKTYHLDLAKASDAVESLDKIKTSRGNISFDERTNMIIVRDVAGNMQLFDGVVKTLDSAASQEHEPLVTKTYPLSFAKASEVVESINKVKTGRGNINFDQRTNVLIVRDVASNMQLFDGVIKTLDSMTPQVLIEAKVMETTLSNTENLGITWAVGGTVGGAQRATSFPFTQESNKLIPSAALDTVSNNTFKYGTLDASGLSATLEMLQKRTDTNILSNPSIVTLDNSTAKIVVGSQYPIPTYTYNTDQAKLQLSGWNYMDIGIIFEVTPHVNNPGLVTLDLQPTITAITDYVLVDPAATAKVPVLSTEQAKTRVMIKDGQTLVIAGLIKNHTTLTKKKVPILGDIPFLGAAFRKKEGQKDKTELLIFLTPHIITANNPSASAVGPASGGAAPSAENDDPRLP